MNDKVVLPQTFFFTFRNYLLILDGLVCFAFAVFIDLSKVFDTIDHNILCDKLSHYGIKDKELMWFKSYLTNRFQITEVGGTASESKIIKTGVPQGSILGPLLFLLYINDLNLASNLKSIMFADDTNLLGSLNDFKMILI